MTDLYNLTKLMEADTITDIIIAADAAYPFGQESPHILVTGFLVAIYIVIIMSLRRYEFEYRIMAASWVCFVLSIFLRAADLLNDLIPLVFLAFAAFTTLYIYTKK